MTSFVAGGARILAELVRGYKSPTEKALAQRIATLAIFKEWDDRLGPSRLWLMRANRQWLTTEGRNSPIRYDFGHPTEEQAEVAYHANRILNFLEDIGDSLDVIDESLLVDLVPSLVRWFDRVEPVRRSFPREWPKAHALIERRWRRIVGEIEDHRAADAAEAIDGVPLPGNLRSRGG